MSDKPKPHIGIKLSRTPESPKSLQAQEEAVRASALIGPLGDVNGTPQRSLEWRYNASDFDHDHGSAT